MTAVPPQAQPDVRRLLEARQRQLRARIAACEQLAAEMAALRAALRSGPAGDSSGPGASGAAQP